jgi:hypothetical protein
MELQHITTNKLYKHGREKNLARIGRSTKERAKIVIAKLPFFAAGTVAQIICVLQ